MRDAELALTVAASPARSFATADDADSPDRRGSPASRKAHVTEDGFDRAVRRISALH